MATIVYDSAVDKPAPRLHRAAYHRSTHLSPARKAQFVAESIAMRLDEGRTWTFRDYGLDDNPTMQAAVHAALAALMA